MNGLDIVFVGHTYADRICRFGQDPVMAVGGSLMYGALAAAKVGRRVGAVTSMAERDRHLIADMERAGIRCMILPSQVTSEFEVVYPTEDLERRVIYQRRQAGPFRADQMPPLDSPYVHLAGNAHGEFSLDFIRAMRKKGRRLSLDMQAFVRQPDAEAHKLAFKDVPDKKAIASCVDVLKLDALEAEVLTGETDPVAALERIAGWGCPEIILTKSDGVLGRFTGETVFVRFTNRNTSGRNGRGDTTLGGYLARRFTHPPGDALRFAAALVSIKLEKPGPFDGTLDQVLARMQPVEG